MLANMSRMNRSSSQGLELSEEPSHAPHQPLSGEEDNDDISTASSYEYESANDLTMWQSAALLTADCVGTGLLALPQDIQVLGTVIGIGFLIFNIPINLYAGTILSRAADHVEEEQSRLEDSIDVDDTESTVATTVNRDGLVRVVKERTTYSSISSSDTKNESTDESTEKFSSDSSSEQGEQRQQPDHPHPHDSATLDYIGLTHKLFSNGTHASQIVMMLYYTNIFLVLGNYVLVMSKAVVAMVGEERICLPKAGILASTLMFAVSQLRTMANLGRSATIVSLASLAIVVAQCLVALRTNPQDEQANMPPAETRTLLRQFSSIASIGFAIGSQKLLLNIRHEMKHREESPRSLGMALSVFGSLDVGICLLAGKNPPSFLFDAIPKGTSRRVAGLLLWIHVAVSYAINSQAICSSMDRIFAHRWTTPLELQHHPQRRWLILTLLMAVSSYLVANAVPFFTDLVALIGALTTVPLTLILPVILHRRVMHLPLWKPTRDSLGSYALLAFGLAFLVTGLAGAVGSIGLDWSNHGAPFSCR